jgi:hypothetical protein
VVHKAVEAISDLTSGRKTIDFIQNPINFLAEVFDRFLAKSKTHNPEHFMGDYIS